ncbi:MAG: MFS transporter, partial [Planctomycetota bacterium]
LPASGAPEPAGAALRGAWQAVRRDRALWRASIGTVAFWSIASLLGQDVLVYGKQVLGFPDDLAAVPYALFAIGVGVGSLLVGRLSRGRLEVGLIPLGAVGLSVGTAAMGLLVPGRAGTFALMTLLGVASGFAVVPLNALVQSRAPAARRGAIIALVNMLSFAGMMLGNLGCLALAQVGFDSATILLLAAALTAAVTVWSVRLLPGPLLRVFAMLIAAALYRVRVLGREQVPASGGALLVPNHVSFLDGLLLLAVCDRPVRFVIDETYYEMWWLKPLLRPLGAIPIRATGGPRVVLRALRDAGAALDEGEVVCMFAEGEISRTGSTLPFRRGLQRLVKGRDAAVVPVHLGGLYGTLGSPARGRMRLLPTQLPCRVSVSFGAPLPADVAPEEVRAAVEELGQVAASDRAVELRPLHAAFVRRARRAPWRACLEDTQGKRLSRGAALAATVVLARRLRAAWGDEERVGVALPPSIGGALASFAASLSGKTAVALNFTVGRAALESAVRQAGLRKVVTSRLFLERVDDDVRAALGGAELVFLEDMLQGVGAFERLGALVRGLLLPIGSLERSCGARRRVRRDDVATILFSSGSTGEPKGVELTHANVQANCHAVGQVLPCDHTDKLVGVLPMFHSFGNMALWFAVGRGMGVVFHPNPLDAEAVGDLVADHGATLLIATPTFLQLYARRVEPGQFGSLRCVLTGAEKLSGELAGRFEERFGLRPIEGYGATECAPAVTVSSPDFRAGGCFQVGAKRGSVGRPLPGVTVRIVDPETFEPVPIGQPGMVLVRGANVMKGYLGRDDLTAEVIRDGFYVTGDIGRLDGEGFLFLTDRLSRFSKIGGEMVPHGVVEEQLQAASGERERAFFVCGVPDARKGERLAVVTTATPDVLQQALDALPARGLPALFVPRASECVHVDELPVLGTGKLDLGAAKRLAHAALVGPQGAAG